MHYLELRCVQNLQLPLCEPQEDRPFSIKTYSQLSISITLIVLPNILRSVSFDSTLVSNPQLNNVDNKTVHNTSLHALLNKFLFVNIIFKFKV